jgi:N-acyl-D-aspartate/D-glutamate deacylase
MMQMGRRVDTLIRGGTIVDGTGSAPFRADIAVSGDRITAVAPGLRRDAQYEIDAGGCLVTPGFIDVHTHYDGQAIWSDRLSPSSAHGVTTVAVGNCGVGFAPCRRADHELLVGVMEGVEDIPEPVMTAGLPWTWESFAEYLAALEGRERDIDVTAYVPHSPLRVYVMGERGAAREAATHDDLTRMARIVEEAMALGALGFSTASVPVHRTSRGDHTPSFGAAEPELQSIAAALRRAGRGVMQVLVDTNMGASEAVGLLERLARTSGGLVTFTLAQIDSRPHVWREILDLVERANRNPGVNLRAQVFPRPVGMLLSHALTLNPFRLCPSYGAIAELSLHEKMARLRDPELRRRLLAEQPADPLQPLHVMARNFERIYPLDEPPCYEPSPETSIAAQARLRGISPEAFSYDLLLEQNGGRLLLSALANYTHASLDTTFEMLSHPDCIPGLGDGGAHYGMICDASFPTFMLTHWVRDRCGPRLSLEQAVAALSGRPAEMFGLHDRGTIARGARADLNIIDHGRLALHVPHVAHDLPAGGRRLDQYATGYVATLVRGEVIARDDRPTAARPGRLVRLGGTG